MLKVPKNNINIIVLVLLCIFLIILPFNNSLNRYWIRIITSVFMWICLAQSWNIIGGYCGRLNFGAAVFFGVGAYTTGALMKAGIPFLLTLPICSIFSVILAIIIGLPTLKLRGAYFAIATWAFAEVLKEGATLIHYIGGTSGLPLPPVLQPELFYFLMFILMIVTNMHVYFINKGKLGYELKAIREDEDTAEVIGVDTFKVKLKAFILSAIYPGICGGIFAQWLTYIFPTDVFLGFRTDEMIIMVLLGGKGTVLGPIIGVIFFIGFKELIWTQLASSSFYIIFLGLFFVFVALFIPDGIYGTIRGKKVSALRRDIIKNTKYFLGNIISKKKD